MKLLCDMTGYILNVFPTEKQQKLNLKCLNYQWKNIQAGNLVKEETQGGKPRHKPVFALGIFAQFRKRELYGTGETNSVSAECTRPTARGGSSMLSSQCGVLKKLIIELEIIKCKMNITVRLIRNQKKSQGIELRAWKGQ